MTKVIIVEPEALQSMIDASLQKAFATKGVSTGYSAQTDPTSAQQTDPTKTDGQFFTDDCCFLMIKDCF